MKILVSIFEVASVAVPLFIALLFLARSGESYREKYDVSKFRFWGFSRRQYVLFFRLVGVLFLLLACFAVYKYYIEEPSAEYNETKEFWDEINKRSGDVFSMAALLGAAIAIPARMASTRFPGKPLALLGGKAVIERVYQACKKSEFAEKTVILTDSIEIAEFADSISAPVVMTSEKCRSGTERIIEAFEEIGAEFVVNVQGDEPFISPKLIDSVIEAHRATNSDLVTAASKIGDANMLINPNVVKVLRDGQGRALYFSRSPLPYVRGQSNPAKWLESCDYWRHIGIYGYSAKALARYDSLPVSTMEKCEMLEQLRFVSAGYKFDIVETDYCSIGIDTPEDLDAAEEYLKSLS